MEHNGFRACSMGVLRNLALTLALVIVMSVTSFADVTVGKDWEDGLTGTAANSRVIPTVSLSGETSYEKLLNLFYPVGCYFSTEDADFDPNTAWGGTWIKLEEGQTLIQAGPTYPLGSTGGEAKHALTAAEMPPHRHWISGAAYDDGNMSYSGSNTQDFGLAGDAGSYTSYDQAKGNGRYNAYAGGPSGADGRGTSAGSVTAHNNMPPYVACNIWKRTA